MVRDAAGRPRQYCPELPCPRLPCAALRGLALRQLCGQNQWGAVSGWGGTPLRHPQGRGDLARASRAQRAKQRACRQDGHRRTLPTRVRLLHLLNEREASLLHRSFASVPLPPAPQGRSPPVPPRASPTQKGEVPGPVCMHAGRLPLRRWRGHTTVLLARRRSSGGCTAPPHHEMHRARTRGRAGALQGLKSCGCRSCGSACFVLFACCPAAISFIFSMATPTHMLPRLSGLFCASSPMYPSHNPAAARRRRRSPAVRPLRPL